ncbi:DUF2585 family protein [Tropicibacter oceani]|uniref:DUF2585 family protein n=2 Tax=Tropicibacter oceani TaxID=3058420 RepID=A0ABY8QP77_9RHOB|nr:DUF2585 family protein [Tropicibacter oceani]WGW05836.1 DUF2585 family protein [Tropicibacter oceani]
MLRPALLFLAAAALMAGVLLLMGRGLICPCGYINLWAGADVGAEQSSQHLFDWYAPSHLIHGFAFYAGLWLLARRLPLDARFAIALLIEAAWELLENSAIIIERYRTVTVSSDYNGDSVVNSLADLLAMAAGFYLARILPVWLSVTLVIGFELLTAALIRDGLALNVLMLLWPLDAVLEWQQGL